MTNFDIKEIYVFSKPYNQATGVVNLDHTETWTYTNNPSGIPGTPRAYFHTPPAEEFTTNCLGEASIKNGGRIETTFTNNVEPIAYDSKGFSIVVHIGWEDSSGVGKSAWVGNGYNGYIPEFPTIALPVAGILGLMLILGRRNKE